MMMGLLCIDGAFGGGVAHERKVASLRRNNCLECAQAIRSSDHLFVVANSFMVLSCTSCSRNDGLSLTTARTGDTYAC